MRIKIPKFRILKKKNNTHSIINEVLNSSASIETGYTLWRQNQANVDCPPVFQWLTREHAGNDPIDNWVHYIDNGYTETQQLNGSHVTCVNKLEIATNKRDKFYINLIWRVFCVDQERQVEQHNTKRVRPRRKSSALSKFIIYEHFCLYLEKANDHCVERRAIRI